jgi:hypothetical protein
MTWQQQEHALLNDDDQEACGSRMHAAILPSTSLRVKPFVVVGKSKMWLAVRLMC